MPTPRSPRPRHCGQLMREVTESDERILGIHAWICDTCKFEQQTLDDFDPPPASVLAFPDKPPTRSGKGINRDPELFGIVRRARRYEARIAGGRAGVWLYLGLYKTIQEAIRARDEALRRRKAG